MKRFLFLFAVMIGFWSIADAQTIVSTEPSNRNVILEEYTGIKCVYCPDGHRIAIGLKEANPGRVYPINIHTGGYAVPSAGDVDLRTMGGDSLAMPAGIQGYPAGSVNRSTTPWAQNRGDWSALANNILSQASPVNIAAETSFDPATNELTVNVEYYYTADEANATNYLTVLINQSEIIGRQTGAANFNPDYVTENGLYRHQHALRMPVTASVWGEPITQTTEGTFGSREFKVTLPMIIGNVLVDPSEMEVVAFISQSKNNIITGTGANIDIADEQKVYLSIENATETPTILQETLVPTLKVKNNSDVAIDGFGLDLYAGQQVLTKDFAVAIQPGATVEVSFDAVDISSLKGDQSIAVIGFKNIVCDAKENAVFDWSYNDNLSMVRFQSLTKDAFTEGKFTFEPNGKDDYLIDATDNGTFQYFSTTQQVNGAENTNSAMVMLLKKEFGYTGKAGRLVFGEADFTQASDVNISYFYAYADSKRGGTAPVIKAQYSEDEGQTWITTDEYTTVQTNTNSFGDNYYFPSSNEYTQQTMSLAGAAGKKVLVRVSIEAGTDGNIIWFDQVEFSGPAGTIYVSDDAIDFGEVTEGDSKEQTITIENKSDAPLNITSITIKDDISNAYYLVDTPTSLTLDANASQTITVEFSPLKKDETYNAKLVINSNDPSNPAVEVALTGKGTGTSVEEEFISNTSLKLMPNPVVTTATLNYNYNGNDAVNVSYTLSDLNGKTVANLGNATITSGTNTLEFDVADLAAGKYFLVITAENGSVQQISVVVEK